MARGNQKSKASLSVKTSEEELSPAVRMAREKRAKIYQRSQKVLDSIAEKIDANPAKYKKAIAAFYKGFMGYTSTGYNTMVALHGTGVRNEIKKALIKSFNGLPDEIKEFLTLKPDEVPTLYRGSSDKEPVKDNDFLSFSSSERIAKMFSSTGQLHTSDEIKSHGPIIDVGRVARLAERIERDATDRWEEEVLGRNEKGYLNDWPEGGLPYRSMDTHMWYTQPENTNEGEHLVFGVKWK